MSGDSAKEWQLGLLRPLRLQLEVPLEGPYVRLLRRPAPEVEALGRGTCVAIVRGTRIREAAPLLCSAVSPYYAPGGGGGLSPEDFQDEQGALRLLEKAGGALAQVRYLAVPAGHMRLPNERWVGGLVEALTPWRAEPVERWRRGVEKSLWLSVLRVYACERVDVELPRGQGPQVRVSPLRLRGLEPVVGEQAFARALDEVVEAVRFCAVRAPQKHREEASEKPYSRAQFARESGCDEERIRRWEDLLARRKQLVFYGPPGTGKTFLAERLARRLVGDGGGFYQVVQFHPAYAYEDFVQGIRPREAGGQLLYERSEGHFLSFCRRARERGTRPCALLIDEINRAPLARVFGELLYLLEHRERAIALAGGGPPFSIPENAYLIGTMNTADRSIALVDQALRRRFAFVRLDPDYQVLTRHLEERGYPAAGLVATLEEINRQVADRDLALGISFFLRAGEDLRQSLEAIWKGEVEPYLEELFYDRPEHLEVWRWEELVKGRLREWA